MSLEIYKCRLTFINIASLTILAPHAHYIDCALMYRASYIVHGCTIAVLVALLYPTDSHRCSSYESRRPSFPTADSARGQFPLNHPQLKWLLYISISLCSTCTCIVHMIVHTCMYTCTSILSIDRALNEFCSFGPCVTQPVAMCRVSMISSLPSLSSFSPTTSVSVPLSKSLV